MVTGLSPSSTQSLVPSGPIFIHWAIQTQQLPRVDTLNSGRKLNFKSPMFLCWLTLQAVFSKVVSNFGTLLFYCSCPVKRVLKSQSPNPLMAILCIWQLKKCLCRSRVVSRRDTKYGLELINRSIFLKYWSYTAGSSIWRLNLWQCLSAKISQASTMLANPETNASKCYKLCRIIFPSSRILHNILDCFTYCSLVHFNFLFPKIWHLLERIHRD